MKKLTLIILLTLTSAVAFASPTCVDSANKVPMWKVAQNFEENEKRQIKVLKETSGKCYEIYGFKNGQKVEIYYNPTDGNPIS